MDTYKTIEGYEDYEINIGGDVRIIKTKQVRKQRLDQNDFLVVDLEYTY